MTLPELNTKRDALLAQIASAKESIQAGDKTISYQQIQQQERALSIIDKEIAVASGSTLARSVLIQHSRG